MQKKMRTHFFIYPKFQGRLILFNSIISLVTLGLIGLSLWLSHSDLTSLGKLANLQAGHPYYQFINVQTKTIALSVLGAVLASSLTTIGISIYLSHKLAGPICRLKSFFGQISETGEVTHLQFRKGDYFEDLPENINVALAKLKDNKDEQNVA